MTVIQVFGVKSSQETRAAERFFKERRAQIQMVDLTKKAMAPGEIRRFLERFGLSGIIDTSSKTYVDQGLQYMKLTEADWMTKFERDPKLLRLPLVRAGKLVSIGKDPDAWKAMTELP